MFSIWLAYLEIRLDPVDVIENLDAHEYVEICDPVSDMYASVSSLSASLNVMFYLYDVLRYKVMRVTFIHEPKQTFLVFGPNI